jgi:hypothetical protein
MLIGLVFSVTSFVSSFVCVCVCVYMCFYIKNQKRGTRWQSCKKLLHTSIYPHTHTHTHKSLHTQAQFITCPFVGVLSHKITRRGTLLLGLIILIAGCLFFGLVGHVAGFLFVSVYVCVCVCVCVISIV